MEKAGKGICKQWKKLIGDSNFRITPIVGKLSCQLVAHLKVQLRVASRDYDHEVSIDICNLFRAVDDLKQTSIAIPAIGTGKISILKYVVAFIVCILERPIYRFSDIIGRYLTF